MDRLLNQNDVRMGMQVARNKHRNAPDAQRLADVANLTLEAMRSGKSYHAAVKSALKEAGIEKSVSPLYWTALSVVIGRFRPTFPLKRTAPSKREDASRKRAWDEFFQDKPGHIRDATRMMYQRGDHLLPDP